MTIDPNVLLYAILFTGIIGFLCGMFAGAVLMENSYRKDLDELRQPRDEHGRFIKKG